MSKIITLVNQKGGVGKTTTTVNLGAYLSYFGKRVLLVDVDPQGNAGSGLGINQADLIHGVYEILIGEKQPHEVTKNTVHVNYSLIPANSALVGAGIEMVGLEDREFRLEKALQTIRNNYDYLLIDVPPSLGLLTINGIVAADEVIIPVQSEYYALEGLGQLLGTINLIQDNLKANLGIMGAVATMFDKRNRLARSVVDELKSYFPNKVFETIIPRSVRLAEAPSYGQSILAYDPESSGAKAYESLAKEVISLN